MNVLKLFTSRGKPTSLLDVAIRTHAAVSIYAGLALALARIAILYITEDKVPHVLIDFVMGGMLLGAFFLIGSAPAFIVARVGIWWFKWQSALVYAGLGAAVVLSTTIYFYPGGPGWAARYSLAVAFGAFAGLVSWKRERDFSVAHAAPERQKVEDDAIAL